MFQIKKNSIYIISLPFIFTLIYCTYFYWDVKSESIESPSDYLSYGLKILNNNAKRIHFQKRLNLKTREVTPQHLSWLDENPIYSKYDIPTSKYMKRVTIAIIISTAPRRGERRQAIRDTFWRECVTTKTVTPVCKFITDRIQPGQPYYEETRVESQQYGDLIFQNLAGGVKFGERLLYHMLYVMKNFQFDYFFRMDDDYFLCLRELLTQLPVPMEPYVHWGWCHTDTSMRAEESIMLFSRDVIEMFLRQRSTKMKCHPLAGQMVAQWALEMNLTDLFRHDSRLHHSPIVSKQPRILTTSNLCSKYIGIHGSYPKEMRTLFKHRGPTRESKQTILDHSVVMKTNIYGSFNWQAFGKKWKYKPKLCINNPTWNTPMLSVTNGAYGGREESAV